MRFLSLFYWKPACQFPVTALVSAFGAVALETVRRKGVHCGLLYCVCVCMVPACLPRFFEVFD